MMNSTERITLMYLQASPTIRVHLGIPTWCGPTGWGKTYTNKLLFRSVSLDPLVVNPQIYLPEDVGGLPRSPDGKHLTWTQPGVFPAEGLTGRGLIWDEVDKAREDVWSALLTAWEEYRIRNYEIPPEVPQVVCMNESAVPLPDPLISRLLFLEWPPRDFSLSSRPELKSWERGFDLFPLPEIQFPPIPQSPRALHRLQAWATLPEFWEAGPEIQRIIARGLFPAKQIPGVMALLTERIHCDPLEWARLVPPSAIGTSVLRMLGELKENPIRIFQTLQERAAGDLTGETQRILDTLEGGAKPGENLKVLCCYGRPQLYERCQRKFEALLTGEAKIRTKSKTSKMVGKKE